MARKIRERVDDPIVAEKLVPKNHGFGMRRVPLESGEKKIVPTREVRVGSCSPRVARAVSAAHR